MQILELIFLINGLKKCKWTSLCTWYVIFALFTHIFLHIEDRQNSLVFLPILQEISPAFLRQQVHMYGSMISSWCIIATVEFKNNKYI